MTKVKWIGSQAFAHYESWECWECGMYLSQMAEPEIARATDLLKDKAGFLKACLLVLTQWPTTTSVHLSDRARNRRAFMGAAACCLEVKATEMSTRAAWWRLTEQQQATANRMADIAIKQWEETHIKAENFRLPNGQSVFPFLKRPDSA